MGRSREFQTTGRSLAPLQALGPRPTNWRKKTTRSKAKRGQRKNKDSKRYTVNAEESPSPTLQPAGQQS
jgi:hypothetical protein